jgi:hypothetical protein
MSEKKRNESSENGNDGDGDQSELFPTEAYARNTDPDTSHEAAESMMPTRAEARAYEALKKFPEGAICSELAAESGMNWNTISPRMAPLCRKGKARDTGQRRPGPSGRNQTVYVAVIKDK